MTYMYPRPTQESIRPPLLYPDASPQIKHESDGDELNDMLFDSVPLPLILPDKLKLPLLVPDLDNERLLLIDSLALRVGDTVKLMLLL